MNKQGIESLLQAIANSYVEDIKIARKSGDYRYYKRLENEMLHNPLLSCYYDIDTLKYILERI